MVVDVLLGVCLALLLLLLNHSDPILSVLCWPSAPRKVLVLLHHRFHFLLFVVVDAVPCLASVLFCCCKLLRPSVTSVVFAFNASLSALAPSPQISFSAFLCGSRSAWRLS